MDFRTPHAPHPSIRDKHCGALQAPWGGRQIHLLDPLLSCFMMGQGSLTARSYLSVRILNINISNSLSLLFLCQKGSWNVQNVLHPDPAAWGSRRVLGSSPDGGVIQRSILPKEGIILKTRSSFWVLSSLLKAVGRCWSLLARNSSRNHEVKDKCDEWGVNSG